MLLKVEMGYPTYGFLAVENRVLEGTLERIYKKLEEFELSFGAPRKRYTDLKIITHITTLFTTIKFIYYSVPTDDDYFWYDEVKFGESTNIKVELTDKFEQLKKKYRCDDCPDTQQCYSCYTKADHEFLMSKIEYIKNHMKENNMKIFGPEDTEIIMPGHEIIGYEFFEDDLD